MIIPGTNYFAQLNPNVNICLTNEDGSAVFADCTGDPNVVAIQPDIFLNGCLMLREDILTGTSLYENQGTIESPEWVFISGSGSGTWTPEGVTEQHVGGITPGTNLGTTPVDISTTLLEIFYPYMSPSVVFNSPAGGIFEAGNTQAPIDLVATTTKHTNPITTFVFEKNATVIYTDPAPSPTGGVETYTDTPGAATNTTYEAIVGDGTAFGTATITFTFVFAYYYGVGAPGLSPAEVGALTKLIIPDTATVAEQFSPTEQVYYFAYPDSYPALTSILDTNGFETIGDWTVTTGNSITNTYGQTDTYRIYQFNNVTTQVDFTNTFLQ